MENSINQRIELLIKELGYKSIRQFAIKIDVAPTSLNDVVKNNAEPKFSTINKIVKAEPSISPNWLITGEGEMLKEGTKSIPSADEAHVDYRFVPLLNLDAVGGMHRTNEEPGDREYPEKLIPFADAREGDVCLTVSGDSMAPTCPSGSLVLVRKVERWQEYFGFGNLFVLLLTDGRRILKEVQKYEGDSKNFVLCKSHNEKYPAEELPKKLIAAVWKVVKMQSDRGW